MVINKFRTPMFSGRKLTFTLAFLCLGMVFFVIPEIAKAATITSISPTAVIPGNTVMTITGTGFGTVKGWICFETGTYYEKCVYNSSTDPEFYWSDTELKVTVPTGIINGNVSVCFSIYSKLLGPAYTILNPVIDSVSSNEILPGDLLTINGQNFGSKGKVCFANTYTCVSEFNIGGNNTWSDSMIVLIVPSLSSEGNITIYNPSLVPLVGPLYTVRIPVISTISSYVIKVKNQITITGKNFGKSGTIYFHNMECSNKYQTIISWSDTSIIFQVECGLTTTFALSNGLKPVIGPKLYGLPSITVGDEIYYTGKSVNITGTQFGTLQGIIVIGGTEAKISSWSDNQVTAVVPSLTFETYKPVREVDIQLYAHNEYNGLNDIASNTQEMAIYRVVSNDPFSFLQAYLGLLGIPESWDVPVNKRVIVAVIDDGVYVNHPELRDNIWTNGDEIIGNGVDDDKNGYIDDIYGYDFYYNTGEMTTLGTHGTMIAGIIAAKRDNGVGVAGINPNATIMPLIVCDSKLGCQNAAISKAIIYAANNGAKIINLSLSTWATTGFTTELDSAIKYAHEKGVVIVAAAGNGDIEGGIGQNLSIVPQSPVCNDVGRNAVIGVGSITDDRYLTRWSNFSGCVDVYTPGVDIVSTAVPAYSTFGDFYDIGSGTSFSSPIITGLVSLLLQKYPSMPPNEVISRIYRHSNTSIIDAISFLSETYVEPLIIPKVLGEEIGEPFIVTGTKKGGGPEVRVFNTSGKLLKNFNAYPDTFRGGINVAVGDIDGNDTREIITSTREGGIPTIRVFDVEGKNLGWDFDAYDSKFRGGINIAVGDIEGDGPAEIAVAPMSGGSPNVRIFGMRNGKIVPVSENFMAYDKNFRGGIAISIGDIDGDGIGDIITTPTSRGGPHIRVFGVRNKRYVPVTLGIMAYAPNFRGGINSCVGDVNGDGKDEVMTGIVSAGGPHVRIFGIGKDKKFGLLNPGFMAYDPASRGGISVASIDVNDDGKDEIITGVGGNGNPTVRIFDQKGKQVSKEFNAYSTSYKSGITLAAGYF